MQIVGIAGGIASGKSIVSAIFKELGAIVLDADQVGHQVLTRPDVRNQVRKHWGNPVFREDDSIDRTLLGKIVFDPIHGPEQLARLEEITHPLIRQTLEDQVRALRESGEFSVAILDAPVMFKAGWNDFCDHVVFVESNRKDRKRRALVRGWTEADFDRREASQVSLDVKRSKSDWIIQNNGTLDDLKRQVVTVWNEIAALG